MTDGTGAGAQGGEGAGGAVAAAIAAAAQGGEAGGAGGGAGGEGGAGGAGGAGGEQGGGEPNQWDGWRDKFLPEDLRGNEALAVFDKGGVPALAKSFVEQQKWARGRVAIPGADDTVAFAEFAGKVRPEKAEDYKIFDAEGKPSAVGEAFRGKFHELGLHPMQAEGIVGAWNQYQADTISQAQQAGKEELTAVEIEHGTAGYTQRMSAAENMLRGMGIEVEDLAPALESVAGAGKAMRALFALAEKTGELAKVDSTAVNIRMGSMSPEAAQIELDAQNNNMDAEFNRQLADPNSAPAQRRKELMRVIAKASTGGR
jgi:hypothetical protein